MPPGVRVEDPFQIVYEISAAGSAQYAHTLAIVDRGAEIRLRHYGLADGKISGQALHAGQFELYVEDGARCSLASLTDWGAGDVHDASTAVVEVGRDAYCHWLPSVLGGASCRHHDELVVAGKGGDMAFRGLMFSQAHEHFDIFAVDLHETGPPAATSTGAARPPARARRASRA